MKEQRKFFKVLGRLASELKKPIVVLTKKKDD